MKSPRAFLWLCWLWISHTYNNKFLAFLAHMLEQCVAVSLTVGDISFAVSKIHTEAVCPMKKLTSWVPIFSITHHLCLHPNNIHWIPTVCLVLGDTKMKPKQWLLLASRKRYMYLNEYIPQWCWLEPLQLTLQGTLKYFTCNVSSYAF